MGVGGTHSWPSDRQTSMKAAPCLLAAQTKAASEVLLVVCWLCVQAFGYTDYSKQDVGPQASNPAASHTQEGSSLLKDCCLQCESEQ